MKLEGKIAIVTGGGQGIGRGIVNCLAEEGAAVVVVDINGDNAHQVADGVKARGGRALAVTANLADSVQVVKTVRDSLHFGGKIDILVNNVGGHSAAPPRTQPPAFTDRGDIEWQGYYEQNLKATVSITREIIPGFQKQHSGKILNIASDAARSADPSLVPYSVFKAGVVTLTFCLAKELAPDNVNVNCICPGWVYSPLVERPAINTYNVIKETLARGQELPARLKSLLPENFDINQYTPHSLWQKMVVEPGIPLQREQTEEDIGRAAVFFVSEDARNITGQMISVDGGMIMR